MTFEDLKQYIDEADAAVKNCEKEKKVFITSKVKVLEHLGNAERIIVEAMNIKKSDSDNQSTLKIKVEQLYQALKQSRQEQLQVARFQTKIAEFLDDTLEDDITGALQNVLKFRRFRKEFQQRLIQSKLEVAAGITQLHIYLEREDAGENTLKRVHIFLEKLRQCNFYEMTETIKEDIIDAFKDATRSGWFASKRRAKRGAKKAYIGSLKTILTDAIEYTNNSKRCWAHCNRLVEDLGDNKYIKTVRDELNVGKYEEDIKLKLGDLSRGEARIKERIKRYAPDEAADLLKQLAAVEIPKEIDWLKTTYQLAEWAYENLGESIGEDLGLPKTAKLEHAFKTPSLSTEVTIPLFTCGVATMIFEFGASIDAGVDIKGELTLCNFLSPAEPNFVTGHIDVMAGMHASAFVGVGLTIIEIIKATGRIVLESEAGLALSGNVSLTKQQIATIMAESNGAFSFILKGYLEATLGLTAPIKYIIYQATGMEAQMSLKTPELSIFEAKRAAMLTFELPFRKEPTSFPKDSFNFDKGEWEVNFIAKQQLKAFWNEQFGAVKRWKEIQESAPLDQNQMDEIYRKYGAFGERA